jgi:hypothetical protein
MWFMRPTTGIGGDDSRGWAGASLLPLLQPEDRDLLGIDLDGPQFQPIVLEDAEGTPHTFRFRSMLVPTGHKMEALEAVDEPHEAYRFAILGDFEADPREQVGHMLMTFEGFTLEARIKDTIEVLGEQDWMAAVLPFR